MLPALILLCVFGVSCKKILQISNPINEVSSNQVFSNDILATAAMTGVYSNMINSSPAFGVGSNNGLLTVYAGASADELDFFSPYTDNNEFQSDLLLSGNGVINSFWQSEFYTLYQVNSVLGGLATATGVHDSVKNELIGEAEVVRALVNFYLVNLFGEVPIVATTNYEKTSVLGRSSTTDVYQLIISDLKDAQTRLPNNYSVGLGERIVPTKFAAAALLARTYLYLQDWADAYAEADTVIANSSLYSLVPLTQVFLLNSNEAIWQLKINAATGTSYNLTPEAYAIIPYTNTSSPFVYLTAQLDSAFVPGDQRWANWIDSTNYSGTTYYYPYKYKAGPAQLAANGPVTEYYMVLRLGEQYLIRAEAQAHGSGLGISGAINDMNMVRARAMVAAYVGQNDPTSVLDSIYHERRVELFAEWGHRWMDLKRLGQAPSALAYKFPTQTWPNYSLLWPIPITDLRTDPDLSQNLGY
jgi:hypothetical protein